VASTDEGKRAPNPNVLVEYGYALARHGVQRLLLVMNTAFGSPSELPFDLRHLRPGRIAFVRERALGRRCGST
jgi:hypothetical protein